MENTQDLSEFGYVELKKAGLLLTAYSENPILEGGVKLEFNPHSGNVFLIDEDGRTAMMNGSVLEEWFVCPEDGHEGFKEDFKDSICKCDYCLQIAGIEVKNE